MGPIYFVFLLPDGCVVLIEYSDIHIYDFSDRAGGSFTTNHCRLTIRVEIDPLELVGGRRNENTRTIIYKRLGIYTLL